MELFAFDDLYVRRLKGRDRQVEEHFYSYFRPLLYAKLRRRGVPSSAIDDLIHETLLRAIARLDDVRDPRKFGAWVNAISNHVLMEWYRVESRAEPLAEGHDDIAGASDIEKEYRSKESAKLVRDVLNELDRRDAGILRALFLEEADKDEICRRFSVDRGYLRVLVHRAKQKFRDLFDPR